MDKKDIKYIISLLEKDHKEKNSISIDKCCLESCWYKRLKLELKNSVNKPYTNEEAKGK